MTDNAYHLYVQLTVLIAGVASWSLFVWALVKLGRRISILSRANLGFVFLFNLALSLSFAVAQFAFLDWIADQFTGFGLGYVSAFAIAACTLGAFAASCYATFLIWKRRTLSH